ncbi:MAG TPA: biotin--[acetyl-CoA-carboxylase] ligase [Candidatus Nitrosotalea sp.]|nr:biotin--[acetyl-CoA-carboxylase] ligase [Candidatus Nitrosotalea sp.]
MYTSFDQTTLDKIVTLLKSHQSEFLSGQKLSDSLGQSRAAVWKNIKKLQSLGYKIESKPNLGYRLKQNTDLLFPWEISDGLQTDIIGGKIYYFDTIDSTQNFALELAQKPHENGSVVVAKKQTRGRGRLGRKWVSPKGGIWLSILLRPNFEPSYTSLFPMLASLALSVAIEKTLHIKTGLKWPNDLTIDGDKVAGILIDASIQSNLIDYLVIGVGINFKVKPGKITKEIKGQKYGIATLVKQDGKENPVRLMQQFLLELEHGYNDVISDKTGYIRKEWMKRSTTIGKNVTVSSSTGMQKGKAVGIDKTGALLLSSRGKILRVLAGDISYQRQN